MPNETFIYPLQVSLLFIPLGLLDLFRAHPMGCAVMRTGFIDLVFNQRAGWQQGNQGYALGAKVRRKDRYRLLIVVVLSRSVIWSR